jgi:hypothetical protein
MMTRVVRRIYLLVLASALVGAAFGSFYPSTVYAQGFGYMCNAWEESCDGGGSYGEPGGGGGAGGAGPRWTCITVPQGCISFGCNGGSNGVPATCSMSRNGTNPNAVCNPGGPCSRQ